MKTREFYIANDITDPTPYEDGVRDGDEVAVCPICGKPICYGDTDVYVMDGREDMPVHESCMVFKKESLDRFCEIFGIDLLKTSGKEVYES